MLLNKVFLLLCAMASQPAIPTTCERTAPSPPTPPLEFRLPSTDHHPLILVTLQSLERQIPSQVSPMATCLKPHPYPPLLKSTPTPYCKQDLLPYESQDLSVGPGPFLSLFLYPQLYSTQDLPSKALGHLSSSFSFCFLLVCIKLLLFSEQDCWARREH